MKWIAISGSWRKMNKGLEEDVRREVGRIIGRGDGIVVGGALNVDYIAADEALKLNVTAEKIKIFLPTTLEIYSAHYRKRAKEGVITEEQAEGLITQLNKIKKANSSSLIENTANGIVDTAAYYERNSELINAADELIAFHVSESLGTKDAINKAHEKGIPVQVFKYEID